MPRRTKRHAKSHPSPAKKKAPAANTTGLWLVKPGADLSLLLSRVRAAQVRRLHFR